VKKKIRKFIAGLLESILIVILVFIVLNIFLGELLIVTGDSMLPTLHDGEQLVGEKLSINFTPPKKGEIVIFQSPLENSLIIKRIVAIPGDTVKIENGKLYINGILSKELYRDSFAVKPGEKIQEGTEYTVPEEHYAVMGDNKDHSYDSRDWGFLPAENIKSRAILVYYPIKNARLIKK